MVYSMLLYLNGLHFWVWVCHQSGLVYFLYTYCLLSICLLSIVYMPTVYCLYALSILSIVYMLHVAPTTVLPKGIDWSFIVP